MKSTAVVRERGKTKGDKENKDGGWGKGGKRGNARFGLAERWRRCGFFLGGYAMTVGKRDTGALCAQPESPAVNFSPHGVVCSRACLVCLGFLLCARSRKRGAAGKSGEWSGGVVRKGIWRSTIPAAGLFLCKGCFFSHGRGRAILRAGSRGVRGWCVGVGGMFCSPLHTAHRERPVLRRAYGIGRYSCIVLSVVCGGVVLYCIWVCASHCISCILFCP